MTGAPIGETLKTKARMIAAHGQEVVKTGAETLRAAGEVVAGARREAAQVLGRTRDELKRTLAEGASRMGDKLSRLATPTRKEQAQMHKAEIKAKKRQRRKAVEATTSAKPDGQAGEAMPTTH